MTAPTPNDFTENNAFWEELFHHIQTSVRLLERYTNELNKKNLEADRAHINQETRHLSRIINHATQFLRTGEDPNQTWEKLEIHSFVHNFCSEVIPEDEKQYFKKNICDKICIIKILKGPLEEVLRILVDNALRYSQPETIISLQSSCDEKNWKFQLRNDSLGLTPEEETYIFKPFARSNDKTSGSGIGLYLAQKIIEQHQGTIQVDSDNKSWVEFEIKIPRIDTSSTENS